MSNSDVLLAVEGLSKSYKKKKAVDNISFHIRSGRITGFLGPNGAGKSTTIKCLMGLIKNDKNAAAIKVRGNTVPLLRDLKHALSIGAMLEFHAFYPNLTAVENLKLLCQCDGHQFDEEKVNSLLTTMNLHKSRDMKAKTFSFGMRQKLALISAFLDEPDMLILDEPVNGLDPNAMDDLSRILKEYAHKGGTVFVSSHILGEVEDLCDDIVIIDNGIIACAGDLKELTAEKNLKNLYLEATRHDNA
ncbi:MAG: ATP-binding cassette domain-containing protein [bacterium]|nr:ATP-binding cassette domain-containing protein [bacterium]